MLKNIFKDKFNLVILISFTMLIFSIIFFWLLGINQAPHVRFFELSGDLQSAEFTNQRLKIFFSSPMNKENTNENITITPNLKFRTVWATNNLFIIFEENLNSNTEYSINFDSNLKDRYGISISTKSIAFKTKPQEFMYIATENGSRNLVKSNLNFKTEIILEDKNLELYDANSQYTVVVTKNSNKSDELTIINLANKQTTLLKLQDKLVPSISFSPTLNEFAYIEQSAIVRSTYVQPLEETKIVVYNIDSKTQKEILFTIPGEGVTSLKFTPDGNSILFKTNQSYYNILEINNPDSRIILGRFIADGGFNFDASRISFIEFDITQTEFMFQYILELNFERESKKITNGQIPVLDPEFYNKKESLIYSKRVDEFDQRTKGRYQIVSLDTNSESIQERVIATDPLLSLELAKLSYDDKYLIAEGYKDTDLLDFANIRTFGFQTKPQTSDLIFVNLETNEIQDLNVRGFNVVWLR